MGELWWKQTCTEIEELEKQGKSDILYQKVRDLFEDKKGSRKQRGIINKDGEMTQRNIEWKEYTEDLYGKDSKPNVIFIEERRDVEEDNVGPKILEDEVRQALTDLKNNKAEGIDNIPAEMLKAMGEDGIKHLANLCNMIYMVGMARRLPQ